MPSTLTTCWTPTHLCPSFVDDDSFSYWRFSQPVAFGRHPPEEKEEEVGLHQPLRASPSGWMKSSSSLLVRG